MTVNCVVNHHAVCIKTIDSFIELADIFAAERKEGQKKGRKEGDWEERKDGKEWGRRGAIPIQR